MPNLSLAKITATLAVLATACSKQAPAPITKPTESPTSTVNATATAMPQPPSPGTASAAPSQATLPTVNVVTADPARKAEAKDASVRPAPMGSATGQMSCGAGACSGAGAAKKK